MARTKLRGVKLNEISFVGKGDNKNANILLLKNHPNEIVALGKEYKGKDKVKILQKWFEDDTSKADGVFKEEEAEMFADLLADKTIRDKIWSMVWMLEDSICSIMGDESGADKGEMISTTVGQFKDAITSLTKSNKEDDSMTLEEALAALKKEQEEKAALVKQVEDVTKENVTLKKEKEELIAKQIPAEVQIDKSKLSPEVRALLEKNEKENEENSKIIKEMQETSITKECIEKAAEFGAVSAEGVVVADVLKSIKKHDSKVYDSLCTLFKTVNARIKEGGLFKEHGKIDDPNAAGGTAYDKMVAKAKELQKANAELSFEKAFDKVFAQEHELRKQYNEEKRG